MRCKLGRGFGKENKKRLSPLGHTGIKYRRMTSAFFLLSLFLSLTSNVPLSSSTRICSAFYICGESETSAQLEGANHLDTVKPNKSRATTLNIHEIAVALFKRDSAISDSERGFIGTNVTRTNILARVKENAGDAYATRGSTTLPNYPRFGGIIQSPEFSDLDNF